MVFGAKAKENLLYEVFCFAVVMENSESDGKGQPVVAMKKRQKRRFIPILDAYKEFFVRAVVRLNDACMFRRKTAFRPQERQVEHPF
jgi:hypothetical protein